MFDFTQDDEKAGSGPVPDGDYNVVVKSMEAKQSDFVAGEKFFNLHFEIVQGQQAGRGVFANWTFETPDTNKDLKVPRGRIKSLALATVKKPAFQSPAEIIGKMCSVRVKNNKGRKRDGTEKVFTNITSIAAPGQLGPPSAAPAGYQTNQAQPSQPWP